MSKARELRDMAEEQIRLVWKDAAESLFRLRIQAQTEKLASPAEKRKHRRTIARCQTILAQRGLMQPPVAAVEPVAVKARPSSRKKSAPKSKDQAAGGA